MLLQNLILILKPIIILKTQEAASFSERAYLFKQFIKQTKTGIAF
jgi:hypothetical protein